MKIPQPPKQQKSSTLSTTTVPPRSARILRFSSSKSLTSDINSPENDSDTEGADKNTIKYHRQALCYIGIQFPDMIENNNNGFNNSNKQQKLSNEMEGEEGYNVMNTDSTLDTATTRQILPTRRNSGLLKKNSSSNLMDVTSGAPDMNGSNPDDNRSNDRDDRMVSDSVRDRSSTMDSIPAPEQYASSVQQVKHLIDQIMHSTNSTSQNAPSDSTATISQSNSADSYLDEKQTQPPICYPYNQNNDTIFIITAQKPKCDIASLGKRKRVCQNPKIKSVSTWTPDLESELNEAHASYNLAGMTVMIL